MAVVEPTVVYPEGRFQEAVAAAIEDTLTAAGRRFLVLQRFGLDIAVFMANQPQNVIRLFEVKSYNEQRPGGVGFGNRRGQGAQVDLLLCLDASLPLLDGMIRWVYADATLPPGSPRYALFTCAKAKAAAMGGVARGKQNNLRTSALRDCLVAWNQLCEELHSFLLT